MNIKFLQVKNLERYRMPGETAKMWELRSNFLKLYYNYCPEERLLYLSNAFINMGFLGVKYSESETKEINELSQGLLKFYEKKTQNENELQPVNMRNEPTDQRQEFAYPNKSRGEGRSTGAKMSIPSALAHCERDAPNASIISTHKPYEPEAVLESPSVQFKPSAVTFDKMDAVKSSSEKINSPYSSSSAHNSSSMTNLALTDDAFLLQTESKFLEVRNELKKLKKPRIKITARDLERCCKDAGLNVSWECDDTTRRLVCGCILISEGTSKPNACMMACLTLSSPYLKIITLDGWTSLVGSDKPIPLLKKKENGELILSATERKKFYLLANRCPPPDCYKFKKGKSSQKRSRTMSSSSDCCENKNENSAGEKLTINTKPFGLISKKKRKKLRYLLKLDLSPNEKKDIKRQLKLSYQMEACSPMTSLGSCTPDEYLRLRQIKLENTLAENDSNTYDCKMPKENEMRFQAAQSSSDKFCLFHASDSVDSQNTTRAENIPAYLNNYSYSVVPSATSSSSLRISEPHTVTSNVSIDSANPNSDNNTEDFNNPDIDYYPSETEIKFLKVGKELKKYDVCNNLSDFGAFEACCQKLGVDCKWDTNAQRRNNYLIYCDGVRICWANTQVKAYKKAHRIFLSKYIRITSKNGVSVASGSECGLAMDSTINQSVVHQKDLKTNRRTLLLSYHSQNPFQLPVHDITKKNTRISANCQIPFNYEAAAVVSGRPTYGILNPKEVATANVAIRKPSALDNIQNNSEASSSHQSASPKESLTSLQGSSQNMDQEASTSKPQTPEEEALSVVEKIFLLLKEEVRATMPFVKDYVALLETCCRKACLDLHYRYKAMAPHNDVKNLVSCELYCNNIFLSAAVAQTEGQSKLEAFTEAVLKLLKPYLRVSINVERGCSELVGSILPIKKVCVKHVHASEKEPEIAQTSIEPDPVPKKKIRPPPPSRPDPLDNFFLVDYCDRMETPRPEKILDQSAKFSQLPLKYDFALGEFQGKFSFRCFVIIANEIVGIGIDTDKKAAMEKGSIVALQRLQAVRPLVKIKENEINTNEIIDPRIEVVVSGDLNKINECIASDNLGHKMLNKMGWSGGGLGKEGEGIEQPVKMNHNFKQRSFATDTDFPSSAFAGKMRSIFVRFLRSEYQEHLILPSDLTPEQKSIVFKMAQKFNLKSKPPPGKEPVIIFTQTKKPSAVINYIMKNNGKIGRYEIVLPQEKAN